MRAGYLWKASKKGTGDKRRWSIFLTALGFIPMFFISDYFYHYMEATYPGEYILNLPFGRIILGSMSEFVGLVAATIVVFVLALFVRRWRD